MDTQAWLDQQDAWLVQTIRRHGWAIQYVGGDSCSRPGCTPELDDRPPFAYTIGMFGMGHPELLVHALDKEDAARVLNGIGERVHCGENLMPGVVVEFGHHLIVPEIVPNPGDIVFSANAFYQRPDEHSVPVLQLTYDDGTGVFPWDEGYPTPEAQPRPGTFTA